jgi:hypothetical protein
MNKEKKLIRRIQTLIRNNEKERIKLAIELQFHSKKIITNTLSITYLKMRLLPNISSRSGRLDLRSLCFAKTFF